MFMKRLSAPAVDDVRGLLGMLRKGVNNSDKMLQVVLEGVDPNHSLFNRVNYGNAR